jgi:hypothetical protein
MRSKGEGGFFYWRDRRTVTALGVHERSVHAQCRLKRGHQRPVASREGYAAKGARRRGGTRRRKVRQRTVPMRLRTCEREARQWPRWRTHVGACRGRKRQCYLAWRQAAWPRVLRRLSDGVAASDACARHGCEVTSRRERGQVGLRKWAHRRVALRCRR